MHHAALGCSRQRNFGHRAENIWPRFIDAGVPNKDGFDLWEWSTAIPTSPRLSFVVYTACDSAGIAASVAGTRHSS